MNALLQLDDSFNQNSLDYILGIQPFVSTSSGSSEDSYQYGNGNQISETYEWAWKDNHKDIMPTSVGFPGPVEGMIQARIEQQRRIQPYLEFLLISENPYGSKQSSLKIRSQKRIRKNRRK